MNVLSSELLLRLPENLHERTREFYKGWVRRGAFVLYWMRTAVRGHENPALDTAIEMANVLGVPIFVYHGISERYPQANDRHHRFMLEGARDVQQELLEKGIGYACHLEREGMRGPYLKHLLGMCTLMVTENMPIHQLQHWLDNLGKDFSTAIWLVDTSCIVPMNLSRRIYRNRDNFQRELAGARQRRLTLPWLEVEPEQPLFVPTLPFQGVDLQKADISMLIEACQIDHSVAAVTSMKGGSKNGYRLWRRFVKTKLANYHRYCKQITHPSMGGMRAYLQYGQVSPFTLARDAIGRLLGGQVFLKELLLDREFAYHYCHQHRDDSARIQRQEKDLKYQYTWTDFNLAQTHDERWNLCQYSLLRRGELNPRLWNYWASRIVAWSAEEQGWKIVEKLYERYSLDGFDPSIKIGLLRSMGFFAGGIPSEEETFSIPEYRKALRLSKGPQVAIVGTGMAAMICAQMLQRYDVKVMVFPAEIEPEETSMEYRIEASDPNFQKQMEHWQEQGLVTEGNVMVGRLLEGQFIEQQRTGRSYFPKPAFSIQIQSGVFFEAAIVNGVQWKNGWKLSSAEGLFESFDELVIAVPLMSMSFMPSFLLEADIIGAKKSIKQSMYCVITSLRIGDAEWDELTFQNPLIEVITKHQDSLFVELTLEWSTAHWDQNENWIEERVMQTVQELLEEEVRGDIKCYRKSRQTVFVQSDCIRNGSRHLSFIGDYFHAGGVQSSWLSGVSCAARILANIE